MTWLPLAIVAALLAPSEVLATTPPALPRVYVDVSEVTPTGRTIAVAAGGDFQAALDSAQPGDVISLQAGATFTGPFTLPVKSGSGWIVVRTSTPDGNLPTFGTRITPAHASLLPKVLSPSSEPALVAAPGAHHFRFVGVEFALAAGVTFAYELVRLGEGSQTSLAQVPHDLIFDRVFVHGTSSTELRRGFALNSASTAIINSHVSDCHQTGFDSQAISGYAGPGPFKIANNYLEASGENIMFGGADPAIRNLVPSDIEIRGNHLYKPLSWKAGEPSFGGIAWSVKNLFELKNAQRVLVVGNVFEHNWPNAQNGFSILFTVRNQDGAAPWSVVSDVTFTHNIVRGVAAGFNMHNTDNNHPSQPTQRLLIQHNLFLDVGTAPWGGPGVFLAEGGGPSDVAVDHNTVIQSSHIIAANGEPTSRFAFTNNIALHNEFGVGGDNTYGSPSLTLTTYFPGVSFLKNAIIGGKEADYPPSNFFPPNIGAVGFVNPSAADYRLSNSSPYRNAGTDGTDLGVNVAALNAETANAISGGAVRRAPSAPGNLRIARPSAAP